MQLVVQYASEIVTGIGIFIATLLLGRYTLNRISQLPEEEKSLGKPLWIATIGILLLGVASIINYVVAIGFADFEMYYYLAGVGGGGFLAYAATMIMGWKKGQALPIVLTIALISVTLTEYLFESILGAYSETFILVSAAILFGIPLVLFSYLTIKTKRITSFGFAVIALTYPLFLVMTTFPDPTIIAIVLAIRVYGPALLITALVLPETGISAELMVYAMTLSSLFYFLSYLLVSPIVADVVLLLIVILVAIASVIGIGTSAYTLTRWRSSRNQATLTLGMFFFIAGFSLLIVALNHIEFMSGVNAEYVALFLAILAPMLLNLSAIIALDWKRILLLPALIMATPLIQIIIYWPQGVLPDDIPLRSPVMAITGVLQTVIPLILYGMLWWRMRKADSPGRSRALFLAIGTFMLIIANIGGMTMTLFGAPIMLGAYTLWWLAVTGRADKLLGTAAK